ncbi:tRNA-dihydrouridine synthase [Escherichia coli]
MQKINQTSAMPKKLTFTGVVGLALHQCSTGTDRHCRYFLRLLSRNTLLYTEMVTTGAIIHGKGDHLVYSEEEHPVALQLGGERSGGAGAVCKAGRARGDDEINRPVGCPSTGCRTACLVRV